MSKMRVAFIGLGSIGTRHLHNVTEFLDEQGRDYEIDIYRSGFGGPPDGAMSGMPIRLIPLRDNTPIEGMYDAVFVTNPTALHFATLERFQNNGKSFFIEKPVFHTAEADLSRLPGLAGKVCYVACPLRYNAVLQYVKEHIDCRRVICARAICSSYLPDWRPGTDYRACYSAHTDMGGGVDIDLIHEWDYLLNLFGPVTEGYAITDRLSALELDSNDLAIYIARTERTALELHLDYFGRERIRELLLFLPDETIRCDIQHGRVIYLRSGETVVLEEDRNEFQKREIRHFFAIVSGEKENDSTIEHALQALRYARGIFK